jgi:spermidine synthase
MPALTRLLYLCFFFSGASALVYEVVWLRWLVHLFGATTLAVSTILTAFMGGLALGSWLAGRLGVGVTRPLRAYGVLELVIAGYALLLPVALEGVVPALRLLGATEAASFALLSLARFVLAGALLVIPTACMGATLPLLALVAAPHVAGLGGQVGRLYAVNTAGAVLGTATAGLLLLPVLGAATTNRIAVAVNLAVGLAALWVDRRLGWAAVPATAGGAPRGEALLASSTAATEPRPAVAEPPVPATEPAAAARGLVSAADPARATEPAVPGVAAPDPAARRAALGALVAIALSGALAMVYEVAWTRALALVLGSSVYAFTVMLATFLLGLAAGSYLLARRVDRLGDPGLALVGVQLLMGTAAFAGLLLLAELPYGFLRLFGWSEGRHAPVIALQFLVSAAVVFVPALLSGAVFPLAVRLAGRERAGVSRAVGNLYAVNTVGAIIGSFAGGFLLLPAAGIRGTLMAAVLVNLAGAALVGLLVGTRRPSLTMALGGAAVGLAVLFPLVAPPWPALTMVSGVAVYAPRLHRLSRREFQERRQEATLRFYEEGLTTTVSVEESRGETFLRVNGKTDASTGVDMPTQVVLGHLPVLFHPEPRDVLVVGLGSGVSVGSVLRHPVRSATVVELEHAVLAASRFFDHVNGRPLEDARTRLVVNDARNFLLLSRERFDVVVSEPSNPWVTGAASLFTRDFFEQARARLRPGGVFGQWLQLYALTPETLRTVVATFRAVFPHTVVFQTLAEDTVLIGSPEPFGIDFPSLARRLAAPAVAADLARVGIREPADLFAWLLLDAEDVPRYAAGAGLNTDDNAYLEFVAPRSLYVDRVAENVQRLADAFAGNGSVLGALLRDAPEDLAPRLARRVLERGQPSQAEAVAATALRRRTRADLLAIAARAAAARGDDAEAELRWRTALALDPTQPETLFDLAARQEAQGGAAEARALIRRAAPRDAVGAALREAALDYRQGAYAAAAARLRGLPPGQPEVARLAGLTRVALGDAAGAEPLLRAALARGEDTQARGALAAALDQLGRHAEARRERRQAAQADEAEGIRLQRQARVRAALGHLRWAEHDLRRARELLPWSLEVREERARLLERLGHRGEAVTAWEELLRVFPDQARAHLEIAALWEAQGDLGRARDALARYVAAEPRAELRRRAEAHLRGMGNGADSRPAPAPAR